MAKKRQSTLSTFCNSIIFIIIGLSSIDSNASSPLDSRIKICRTARCNEAAQRILQNMDPTINPCDNFYRFACGKFVKETPIPDDRPYVSLFTKQIDQLYEKLKQSMEEELEEGDPKTFKLIQSYYNVCLNNEQIETTELTNILNNLGGWPVLEGESWNEFDFDWIICIRQLREIGHTDSMQSLIGFYIGSDQKNTSRNIITLDQAETGLAVEYLSKGLENEEVQAYFTSMVEFAKILGADDKEAEKQPAQSLNFEIELAKISEPKSERRSYSKLYNLKTIRELQSEYPDIPWLEYFNQLMSPKHAVDLTDEVVVIVPSFLQSFSQLLSKTPKRVLANYMIWRTIYASSTFMNGHVRNVRSKFDAKVTGTVVDKSRWVHCINYVSKNLPLATGALYVRKNFNKKTKNDVSELASKLRGSFKNMISKIDWMDGETKKAALLKLDLMQPHVAYPDEFFGNEKLDKYFENINVEADSFLKSHLNLNKYDFEENLEMLAKPVDKTSWITHGRSAIIITAFYWVLENSFQIPAGILQQGFFESDWPNYMIYGTVGWLLGHEMTHGFDDNNIQYDKNGNLVNWWDEKSKQEFLKRAQCIIDQYSNYTVEEVGLKVIGKNTQSENIADNGAIKEAYFAYEKYERENGQELRLPGLPYSPRQLFWISGANMWCTKHRENYLKNHILTGVHAPEEFRVIGPFSNTPQFSNDFNCPLGSPMNPVKKCTVW